MKMDEQSNAQDLELITNKPHTNGHGMSHDDEQHEKPFLENNGEPNGVVEKTSPPVVSAGRVALTVFIILACTSLVSSQMIFGPALLDFQILFNTSLQQTSWILTTRGLGCILGTLISGQLVTSPTLWIQLPCYVVVAGLFTIIVPWIPQFYVVCVLCGLGGIIVGIGAVGTQVALTHLWRGHKWARSWLYVYSMIISVGIALQPILLRPFMTEKHLLDMVTLNNTTTAPNLTSSEGYNSNQLVVALNRTDLIDSKNGSVIFAGGDGPASLESMQTDIAFGFLISGGIQVLVGLLFSVVICHSKSFTTTRIRTQQRVSRTTSHKIMRMFLTGMVFTMQMLYGFFQRCFLTLSLPFLVEHAGIPKTTAALITSSLSIANIASLLITTFLSMCISVEKLLIGYLLSAMGALFIIILCGHLHMAVLWTGMLLYTFLTVPTFGNTLAWAEKYLVLAGHVASFTNLGARVGEMIGPLIYTVCMEYISNKCYLYVTAIALGQAIFLFIPMCLYGSRYKKIHDSVDQPPHVATES